MTVSSLQARQQPAFKNYGVVQIRKSLFPQPENLEEAAKLFHGVITDVIPAKSASFVDLVSDLISGGTKNFRKIIPAHFFFEQPGYLTLKKRFSNLHWLSQNTGIKIKPEMSPDFHSFLVLTGSEKNNYLDLAFSRKGRSAIKRELHESVKEKGKVSPEEKIRFILAKKSSILMRLIGKATENNPPAIMKVDKLDDLPNVLESLPTVFA